MLGLKKKALFTSEVLEQAKKLERLHEIFTQAEQVLRYTPDAVALERKLQHLVFFCDGHMRGRYDHDEMKEFPFKGTCFTQGRYYHWMRKLGLKSFTIPIPVDESCARTLDTGSSRPIIANPARIKGELYLIDTENLKNLDSFRENGVRYIRRRKTFLMPVRKQYWIKERDMLFDRLSSFKASGDIRYTEMHVVSAWMYEAVPEFWEDQLDGGYSYSPIRVFKPTKNVLGNYSFFTDLEYEHTPTYDTEPSAI